MNLKSYEGPYIHFTANLEQLTARYLEPNEQIFTILIDGQLCTNSKSLFKTFASKLQFPSYFGKNWDAFDECMRDLDWLENEYMIIYIKNFDSLLMEEPQKRHFFMDVIKGAIHDSIAGEGYGVERFPKPFHVVLHSKTRQSSLLEQQLPPSFFQIIKE